MNSTKPPKSPIFVVKARKYSWRKTATYFQDKIRPGTRFDLLPLESLKLIFQYKVIAEAADFKKEKKMKKEKAGLQRRLIEKEKREKLQRHQQRRLDEITKENKARRYNEGSEKLYKRFGSLANFKSEYQRQVGLQQIYNEKCIEIAKRQEQEEYQETIRINREFAQRRYRIRFLNTGFIDPFYFGSYMGRMNN